MPGSLNFLPFNPSDTINTDSDTEYLAESQRTGGIQTGIAKTKMHNKFYRQMSVMVTALAQFMANQGQTVSDGDVDVLTTVITNSFMQRGVIYLDTGVDASSYVWQNGVYACSVNVTGMATNEHTWIVKSDASNSNNVYLYAIDLSVVGTFYIRQKVAGVWGNWINQSFDSIYIKHSLATAINDFLVASGPGVFAKKTLNEVKVLLFDNPTFTTNATSPKFTSTVATGTPPLTVASKTKVPNLNSETIDGRHFFSGPATTPPTALAAGDIWFVTP